MRNTKKPIQLYRGTTQQHSDYAGPVGEITVDTEKYTVVVQNGATGGVPLAREDTVVSLTNRIAAEESARATADTTLQNNIDSEASSRATADTAIQKSVTDEVSARKAADTTLQNNIDSEASARETADNAFQKQIDNLLQIRAVIGEVRWFALSTPPEGWLVCNGAAVGTSDYPALFAAIGRIFALPLIDTEPGVDGPEYIDPTVFRLPNLIGKVPWGSTSVGTVLDAGLPNIEGKIFLELPDGGSPVDSVGYKALYNKYSARSINGYVFKGNVTRSDDNYLRFDASRSNSIYGRSDTVQPPALCLLPCIRYE